MRLVRDLTEAVEADEAAAEAAEAAEVAAAAVAEAAAAVVAEAVTAATAVVTENQYCQDTLIQVNVHTAMLPVWLGTGESASLPFFACPKSASLFLGAQDSLRRLEAIWMLRFFTSVCVYICK